MPIFSRFFSDRGIANSKLFLIGLVTVVGPWSIYILSVNLAEKRRLLLKGKKDEEISDKTSVVLEQKIVETSVVSPESYARKILIIYGTCTLSFLPISSSFLNFGIVTRSKFLLYMTTSF